MEVATVSADQLARDEGLDSVVCDEAAAAALVVQHLLAQGHREIVYAEYHSVSWQAGGKQRRECLQEEAARSGMRILPDRCLVEMSGEINGMVSALGRKLQGDGSPPTAIVVDSAGVGAALFGQLAQMGIRVPKDVSLAAIGSSTGELAALRNQITRCEFDFHDVGSKAIGLLEERRVTPVPEEPDVRSIAPAFVPGASTPPLRKK